MMKKMMSLLALCFSIASFWVFPLSLAAPPYKAVALGGWLVTEGWMTPSLFDKIPNSDLLDGTQIQIQNIKQGKYLSSEKGVTSIASNRSSASIWGTFTLWRINKYTYNFRCFHKQFVGLKGNDVVAAADSPGASESFKIVRHHGGNRNRIRIKASNGLYLQVKSDASVTADYEGSGWGDDNPSVFNMTVISSLLGEYQVTNGYGPKRAAQVMRKHWNTYITEKDFKFMSENGVDAVRIPVGWWMASDPNPPKPFVSGSLHALDNAFSWAGKHGIKVIIDLHAVNGSQNGNAHSASRDGSKDWGESNINETVAVIDFLTARYANHKALLAVELMNEPNAPGVTLDNLMKYYKAGYETVRKYTSSAYVILSNRLGHPADPKEFLSFKGEKIVIDVHYYNLFTTAFTTMNAKQNIDYVYKNRTSDLSIVTKPNGPLTFVGEWVSDWEVNGATSEEFLKFTKAQLEVYGQATFGWAYWSYKCVSKHWDIGWMIKNGFMKL